MPKFSDIKVLIWDFDGTFYPLTPDLTHAMEEEQYATIMRHLGWGKEAAKTAFWKVYPKETTSGNAAVGIICGIPTAEAARESEINYDRLQFVKNDPQLIEMFNKLKHFRHFVLGNGVREKLTAAAQALGIPDGTFEEIVTSEVTGVNKPETAGYLYILKKTGLKPEEHLMIGDREVVDLTPAKKVGMHTCLVTWGTAYPELSHPGSSVDVTIPVVYDLSNILSLDSGNQ
jgi:HAD superfamily hydrolase (TIGR01549 family)